MISFSGGPADDLAFELASAPLLIRVVQSPTGNVAVLDLPDDEPLPEETLLVYVREGEAFSGFIDWSDKRGRRGGMFLNASYRLLTAQPSDSVMRDRDYWTSFCDGYLEEVSI